MVEILVRIDDTPVTLARTVVIEALLADYSVNVVKNTIDGEVKHYALNARIPLATFGRNRSLYELIMALPEAVVRVEKNPRVAQPSELVLHRGELRKELEPALQQIGQAESGVLLIGRDTQVVKVLANDHDLYVNGVLATVRQRDVMHVHIEHADGLELAKYALLAAGIERGDQLAVMSHGQLRNLEGMTEAALVEIDMFLSGYDLTVSTVVSARSHAA